jgi:hypothetical protein
MSRKTRSDSKLTTPDYVKITAITIFILAVVLTLVLGCCFAIYGIVTLPCGNNVIDEVYSPDQEYKVVVFQSGCGVNSTDFMNVAILKSDQQLATSGRDLFPDLILTSDVRDIGEIQVIWKTNRSIQITCSYSNEMLEQKREFNLFNQIFTVYYEEKGK